MKDGLIKLKIGGKERSLKFNMRAIETFAEIKNNSQGSISSSVTLIYAGLMGWHYAKQVEPDFSFEDVTDWVEELIFSGQTESIAAADKCFSDSRAFKYFSEQVEAEAAKKK
jgi:hypothetical protein